MQKSLIITIGILLILTVLGVWLYLLFFGTPENSDDVLSDLGIGTITPTEIVEPLPPENTELPRVDTNGPLNQLTTKPVAGFGFVGSSTNLIRYVEQGTGHIYEIDTTDGDERRLSQTTIPRTRDAVISPDGTHIAITTENDRVYRTVFGFIDPSEETRYTELPAGTTDHVFLDNNTLHYTVTTSIGTDGYRILSGETEALRLFSIPLRDVTTIWREGETFVYNKPAVDLEGSLYRVDSGLTPVLPAGNGFVGGVSDGYYLGTYLEDGRIVSVAADRSTNETIALSTLFIPEKCTFGELFEETLTCAEPNDISHTSFVLDWYSGIEQTEDSVWDIQVSRGISGFIVNPLSATGRAIDVDGMTISLDETMLLFRNKVDNTLWMYDETNGS